MSFDFSNPSHYRFAPAPAVPKSGETKDVKTP